MLEPTDISENRPTSLTWRQALALAKPLTHALALSVGSLLFVTLVFGVFLYDAVLPDGLLSQVRAQGLTLLTSSGIGSSLFHDQGLFASLIVLEKGSVWGLHPVAWTFFAAFPLLVFWVLQGGLKAGWKGLGYVPRSGLWYLAYSWLLILALPFFVMALRSGLLAHFVGHDQASLLARAPAEIISAGAVLLILMFWAAPRFDKALVGPTRRLVFDSIMGGALIATLFFACGLSLLGLMSQDLDFPAPWSALAGFWAYAFVLWLSYWVGFAFVLRDLPLPIKFERFALSQRMAWSLTLMQALSKRSLAAGRVDHNFVDLSQSLDMDPCLIKACLLYLEWANLVERRRQRPLNLFRRSRPGLDERWRLTKPLDEVLMHDLLIKIDASLINQDPESLRSHKALMNMETYWSQASIAAFLAWPDADDAEQGNVASPADLSKDGQPDPAVSSRLSEPPAASDGQTLYWFAPNLYGEALDPDPVEQVSQKGDEIEQRDDDEVPSEATMTEVRRAVQEAQETLSQSGEQSTATADPAKRPSIANLIASIEAGTKKMR